MDDLREVPGKEKVVAELQRELTLVAQGKFEELEEAGKSGELRGRVASLRR